MLAENKICKVQSQNFALMQKQYFDTYALQEDCRVVMPLSRMLAENSKMCELYAQCALEVFKQYGICSDKIWENNYWQLAHYGVLMSNLVLGYNVKEPEVSKRLRLYTSSITLLTNLARKGILHSKKGSIEEDLLKLENEFYESKKFSNTLKDGKKFFAVRLDFEVIETNKMRLVPTIPKSAINLDDYLLIPYNGMQQAYNSMYQLLLGGMYTITSGDKVRTVTCNDQILSSIYGADRAQVLMNGRRDVTSNAFYVPSVGASIYTSGITNLMFTEIDKITPVQSIAEIDLTELKLDLSMVADYFADKVSFHGKDLVDMVVDFFGMDISDMSSDEVIEAIRVKAHNWNAVELWQYMKKNQKYFNTAEYLQLPNKYGNFYQRVSIPQTKDMLEQLLQVGVFKILIQKRNGTYSTIIGTNNSDELRRILGGNYFAKYESTGVKLNYLKRNFDKIENFYEECAYLGIDGICEEEGVSREEIKANIESALLQNETRKTVVKQPHLATVRNCQALGRHDFYTSVDLHSIVDLVCLNRVSS